MRRFALVFLLVCLAAGAVRAADEAPVGVDSLAWLAGRWTCQALGGTVEDVWAPPAGGQMVGMFRLVKDGTPAFYEIMLLLMVEDRLTLRLKHFGPDLHGWEEKTETVDFPLEGYRDGVWSFAGLVIERTGEDAMTIHLSMGKPGQKQVVDFVYSRVGRF